MHYRNIVLTAAFWAFAATLLLWAVPPLARSDALGVFYFPALVMAVLFSGTSHAPSDGGVWGGFVVFGLIYCLVFVVIYALAWEFGIRRQELKTLSKRLSDRQGSDTPALDRLRHIGATMARIETRRRGHFLLRADRGIDLSLLPEDLAAHALREREQHPTTRRIMKRFELELASTVGDADARLAAEQMRSFARSFQRPTAHSTYTEPSLLQSSRHSVARAWAFWRDLRFVLAPCRFSVFVVVVGGVLLLLVPQGRELTVQLVDEPWGTSLAFCLAVTLLAFEAWYWARFILDAVFGSRRWPTATGQPRADRIRWLVDHVPRAIAFCAFGFAIVACLQTGLRYDLGIAALLLVLGSLFYLLLVKRRTLVERVVRRQPRMSGLVRRSSDAEGLRGLAPLSRAVFWVSLAASAAFAAWVWADPVSAGWSLGAAAVPFVGFAAIVPVGSLAVYFARDGGTSWFANERGPGHDPRVGYPVVTIFVGIAVLFSLWVDNHAVRTLRPTATQPTERQPVPAGEAIDRWYASQPAPAANKPLDIVVVATAGGGIRAAYWTTTVLGAIQDREPAFAHKLLAISGVSGGSLGAATFATLLSLPQPLAPGRCTRAAESPDTRPPGPFECTGQTVMSQDFLSPTVAALLFSDLMQQFLPVAVLPDRAAALEQAWERAWSKVGVDPTLWGARPFEALWSGPNPVPALLLNGTSVETGKRIITSHLKIDLETFPDAFDFFDLLDPEGLQRRQIRTSTAAHNSARFTYVSPAGRINGDSRIVDGGYYENFGAKTASEMLLAAIERLRREHPAQRVRPIVVLISNDPAIDPREMPPTSADEANAAHGLSERRGLALGSEISSPPLALLQTRDAHGFRASHDLRAAAGPEGLLFHFRLCREGQPPRAPVLGWVLSREAEEQMRHQLRSAVCGNQRQLDRLVEALAGR